MIPTLTNPQKTFYINPFGNVELKEIIHRGKFYNIYRATFNGENVCLKATCQEIISNNLFYSYYNYQNCGSEAFYSAGSKTSSNQLSTNDLQNLTAKLLVIEAELIKRTNQYWNHKILGLGLWNNSRQTENTLLTELRPVLIMPDYQDTTPLSKLSEKRTLFLRMLPALFQALSYSYHGDLSEDNLLIKNDFSIFYIIDPGVIVSSETLVGEDHFSAPSANSESFFISNSLNYPILAPFQDETLLEMERNFASANKEHQIFNLVTFLQHFKLFRKFGQPLFIKSNLDHKPKTTRSSPYPSDLLALGIIYYRILTGENLFYDRETELDHPIWLGESRGRLGFGTPNESFENFNRVLNILENNYIARKLAQANIGQKERNICNALLNLTLRDKDHLAQLIMS